MRGGNFAGTPATWRKQLQGSVLSACIGCWQHGCSSRDSTSSPTGPPGKVDSLCCTHNGLAECQALSYTVGQDCDGSCTTTRRCSHHPALIGRQYPPASCSQPRNTTPPAFDAVLELPTQHVLILLQLWERDNRNVLKAVSRIPVPIRYLQTVLWYNIRSIVRHQGHLVHACALHALVQRLHSQPEGLLFVSSRNALLLLRMQGHFLGTAFATAVWILVQ